MSKLWKALTIALSAVLFFVPIASGQQHSVAQMNVRVEPVSSQWDHWGPGYYFGGPNQGTLRIKTDLKRAAVFVDGAYVGRAKTIGWLTLLPGTHFVELRDVEGVVLSKQLIKIKSGHLSTVDFRS